MYIIAEIMESKTVPIINCSIKLILADYWSGFSCDLCFVFKYPKEVSKI